MENAKAVVLPSSSSAPHGTRISFVLLNSLVCRHTCHRCFHVTSADKFDRYREGPGCSALRKIQFVLHCVGAHPLIRFYNIYDNLDPVVC
ncbi:hypothetical protein AOLI_G00060750 [Acnodon oligacanthus]